MDVKQIHATARAYCAVCGDGRAVAWGDAHWGGDSREALNTRRVRRISATSCAFAAILEDGWVCANLVDPII